MKTAGEGNVCTADEHEGGQNAGRPDRQLIPATLQMSPRLRLYIEAMYGPIGQCRFYALTRHRIFPVSHLVQSIRCPFHERVHRSNNISFKEDNLQMGGEKLVEIQCLAEGGRKTIKRI